MFLVYLIVTLLVLVFIPKQAYAWGPAMHTFVASTVLTQLSLVTPLIKSLLEKYHEEFLYGAVIPDIVIGKKYAGYMHHCHNWKVGWQILKESTTLCEKSAAYGYLVHLAADTVAHNYYIPFKIVKSYQTRTLSHTYWEMRFDIGVPENTWTKIEIVSRRKFEEFDRLLERVLKMALFSFKTNRRIFSSILNLQKMHSLRRSLKIYEKASRWEMGRENRQHYVDLTMEVVFDFLSRPKEALCLEIDPTGSSRIEYAKRIRRNLKRALRRGTVRWKKASKILDVVQERLAVGLYRPTLVLPEFADIL